MASQKPSISPAELDVLKTLWKIEGGTARRVNDILKDRGSAWSYATVLTLLRRLEAKGYVTRDKSELAHEFRPTVSRDKLLSNRLCELADELCDGTMTPLVLALVRGRKPSAREVKQVRALLDELEAQESRSRGRKRKRRF